MEPGKKPRGGKPTRVKYDDELARVEWREFERIIDRWYTARGYTVEHRGTGSKGMTDGGVDLVLKGHGEKVLVQCKHAKAWQVPYNAAMQLRGLIHAEKEPADRAILITSGEFTPEALSKARTAGLLEMIDGKALRDLLGPDISGLRDSAHGVAPPEPASPVPVPTRVEVTPSIMLPRTVTAEVSLPPAHTPAERIPTPTAPTLRNGSHITSRPVASGVSRGVAAGCAVVCLGIIALVVFRLREDVPAPLPESRPEPVVAIPAPPTPTTPRRASHETPVVKATPHGHPAMAAKAKVVPPRPSEKAVPVPPPVIYKSSNMSDAEFAAWKLRKAQREEGGQVPTTEVADSISRPSVVRDSARTELTPTDLPGVPAQTMQVILRTNRRQPD